ncbi:DUF6126 family protein [Streptomyces pharetrae]
MSRIQQKFDRQIWVRLFIYVVAAKIPVCPRA